jgi:hypothetical protein
MYVSTFEPGKPKLRLYYDSLNNWEAFALQCQMARDLYLFISKSKAFDQGDGSPEQRLYDLANAVKHFRGHLDSQRFTPADILPMWITRDGLVSINHSVTYAEAAGVLRDLSKLAHLLQDPVAVREARDRATADQDSPLFRT